MTTQTFRCDYTSDGGYPSRVQALLRSEYAPQTINVTNSGVPGEFTDWGRARFPSALTSVHDLAIIMEGVNDLNNGTVPIDTIVGNLRSMVQTAKARGRKVMLGSVLPVVAMTLDGLPVYRGPGASASEGDAIIRGLNARIERLAQDEKITFVDFYFSFTKPGINTSSLFSGDGLHPNALGYARMAELVKGHVIEDFDGKPAIVP